MNSTIQGKFFSYDIYSRNQSWGHIMAWNLQEKPHPQLCQNCFYSSNSTITPFFFYCISLSILKQTFSFNICIMETVCPAKQINTFSTFICVWVENKKKIRWTTEYLQMDMDILTLLYKIEKKAKILQTEWVSRGNSNKYSAILWAGRWKRMMQKGCMWSFKAVVSMKQAMKKEYRW